MAGLRGFGSGFGGEREGWDGRDGLGAGAGSSGRTGRRRAGRGLARAGGAGGPGGGHGGGHGGGGGHEGAGSMRWLLTYADLITLLLAFFVVMYAMSEVNATRYRALAASLRAAFATAGEALIDTKGISPDARKVLDGLNQDTGQPFPPSTAPGTNPAPEENPGGQGEGPGRLPVVTGPPGEEERLRDLVDQVNAALRDAGLGGRASAQLTDRGVAIIFEDQVFFDLGRADLRPEGRELLRRLAPILARVPGTILVEGHTDNLPIHSDRFPSNWELSTARATTVVRFLAEQAGLDPRRLAAAGYGEWRPRFPNTSEANRARNRRVEIVVLRQSLDPTARAGVTR
ncbi:OmpA/MotB domain protein [Thermaerobacter marianensis DSM 12885]|uniref:OmpA/MotB domain protein n=1 Tax=Thermaerobacter marianensis (strain ATCC 700841 / DSM 12885 / JCM 10246 / 7p75a) TaxID=644966 RepID=E6SI29_THEM7|nr:flagellar motor protein MotB [Thermaerobacter marianensis]ADU50807.1 OmpA/MotB domain protein [Thermaerobacter marianensis DSM 12885]